MNEVAGVWTRRYDRPRIMLDKGWLLAIAIALSIAAVGCDFLTTPEAQPTKTPPRPTATAPATEAPATQRTDTPTADGLVLRVTLAVGELNIPDYDRGEWRHWIDEDRDCQNARQEVLIEESKVQVAFVSSDECRVESGGWVGPYTGLEVSSPGDLDVDHMVPLENAHRSGAWAWDRDRKREYANYLLYEDHLIATTSGANRSKGSRGPEEWRPPLESYWCDYAADWVAIKDRWELTVTEAEFRALREMLDSCPMPVLLQRKEEVHSAPTPGVGSTLMPAPSPSATPTPTSTPTSGPAATVPPGLRYDPFGPDRDCGDFDTYEEALDFFLAAGGPEQDPHLLDSDGDGEPCTSLPRSGTSGESKLVDAFSSAPIPSPTPTKAAHSISNIPSTPSATSIPTPSPMPVATPRPTATPTPTATAIPTPTPHVRQFSLSELPFNPYGTDRSCDDFATWWDAQNFYHAAGGPSEDPHRLDGNGDGIACESLPGAPRDDSPPASTPVSTSDEDNQDRNCGDFDAWEEAQEFFLSEGGPASDPHGLDSNRDGYACESLPGFER